MRFAPLFYLISIVFIFKFYPVNTWRIGLIDITKSNVLYNGFADSTQSVGIGGAISLFLFLGFFEVERKGNENG